MSARRSLVNADRDWDTGYGSVKCYSIKDMHVYRSIIENASIKSISGRVCRRHVFSRLVLEESATLQFAPPRPGANAMKHTTVLCRADFSNAFAEKAAEHSCHA
jgi:hypothetical protein